MRVPVESNTALKTVLVVHAMACQGVPRCGTSQTRAVWSIRRGDDLARPSRSNVAATHSVLVLKRLPRAHQCARPDARRAASEAVTIRLARRIKDSGVDSAVHAATACQWARRCERPNASRAVSRSGDDAFAFRVRTQRHHLVIMHKRPAHRLACSGIPDAGRMVGRGRVTTRAHRGGRRPP